MAALINRLLSFLVLAGYIFAAYRLHAIGLILKAGLPLLLAIACIWFPDELGDFTGVVAYHPITTTSSGVLICVVGWLILLGLPLAIWYVASWTHQI